MRRGFEPIWGVALVVAAVFAADSLLPFELAGGMPYVLPVLLAGLVSGPRQVVLVGSLCGMLAVIGVLVRLPAVGEAPAETLFPRALALVAIAVAARLGGREAQRRRLREMVEAAPTGIVLIDRDRSIMALNASIEELFDRPRAALVGQPIEKLIPKLFSGDHQRWFADLIAHGVRHRVLDGNLAGMCADGREVPIEVELARAQIDGIPYVIAAITDVTDRSRRQAALLAAKDAAEASERAKSDLIANVSHEIRTPLNTVLGLTEATLRTNLDEAQRDHLRSVLDSSEALLSMLDYLDLARVESGGPRLEQIEFDLRDAVGSTLDSLAIRAHDKGLQLTCSIDPALPAVLIGDSGRLRQVLTQLVDNAIKFTDRGEVAVRVELEASDGYGFTLVYFSVRDTGAGIAPELLDRIFEPFQQARRSSLRRASGSGLGLSICQQVLERMGGHVGVESTVGEGSTFHFTVGFDAPRDPLAGEAAAGEDHDQVPPLRILLVEDSVANQKVARAILAAHGHAIEVAQNGLEGVERAAAGGFDVVLMDVQMPVQDGLEATASIRAAEAVHGGHVPIIAMTAHALRGDREKCLAAGMDDYVAKPVRRRELLRAVARAVQSR